MLPQFFTAEIQFYTKGYRCSIEQWRNNFSMLKQMGVKSIDIYGLETFGKKDSTEIIRYLNALDIQYIMHSGEVIKDIGCVSIDSPEEWGFIRAAKGKGIKDIIACVEISSHNLPVLDEVVDQLLDTGAWVRTIFIHHSMDKRYTGWYKTNLIMDKLFGLMDDELVEEKAEYLKRLFFEGKKIYNIPAYFDEWSLPSKTYRSLDWKCGGFTSLSIMADGTLRPCFNWMKNGRLSELTISDLHDMYSGLIDNVDLNMMTGRDTSNCPGCFNDNKWMCKWMVGKDNGYKIFDLSDSVDRVETYNLIQIEKEKK